MIKNQKNRVRPSPLPPIGYAWSDHDDSKPPASGPLLIPEQKAVRDDTHHSASAVPVSGAGSRPSPSPGNGGLTAANPDTPLLSRSSETDFIRLTKRTARLQLLAIFFCTVAIDLGWFILQLRIRKNITDGKLSNKLNQIPSLSRHLGYAAIVCTCVMITLFCIQYWHWKLIERISDPNDDERRYIEAGREQWYGASEITSTSILLGFASAFTLRFFLSTIDLLVIHNSRDALISLVLLLATLTLSYTVIEDTLHARKQRNRESRQGAIQNPVSRFTRGQPCIFRVFLALCRLTENHPLIENHPCTLLYWQFKMAKLCLISFSFTGFLAGAIASLQGRSGGRLTHAYKEHTTTGLCIISIMSWTIFIVFRRYEQASWRQASLMYLADQPLKKEDVTTAFTDLNTLAFCYCLAYLSIYIIFATESDTQEAAIADIYDNTIWIYVILTLFSGYPLLQNYRRATAILRAAASDRSTCSPADSREQWLPDMGSGETKAPSPR